MAERLPENLRQLPRLWEVIGFKGLIIPPNVYLRRRDYQSFVEGNPTLEARANLAHEQVHLERILELGASKHRNLYYGSKTYRLSEELDAYQAEMTVEKMAGRDFDIAHYTAVARGLSGIRYFWAAPSFNSAMDKLEEAWAQI